MITIDQLLESVDLDFEPRFVTKDESGLITIWADKPSKDFANNMWIEQTKFVVLPRIKLAEFENKPWQECIYEVPRKTTGKIERLKMSEETYSGEIVSHIWKTPATREEMHKKINEIIDWINDNHKDFK